MTIILESWVMIGLSRPLMPKQLASQIHDQLTTKGPIDRKCPKEL